MSDSEIAVLYGELKEIRAEIRALRDEVARAYADGYPRCTRNTARIEHVEESFELCHGRISGIKRWMIAVLVAGASWAANTAWNMLLAKH